MQNDVLTQSTNSPSDSSVYQGEKGIAWSRECASSVEVTMHPQESVNKNKRQTIVLMVFITQIIFTSPRRVQSRNSTLCLSGLVYARTSSDTQKHRKQMHEQT